jgi:hypothetical protein
MSRGAPISGPRKGVARRGLKITARNVPQHSPEPAGSSSVLGEPCRRRISDTERARSYSILDFGLPILDWGFEPS